jgi:hypothetical protein
MTRVFSEIVRLALCHASPVIVVMAMNNHLDDGIRESERVF